MKPNTRKSLTTAQAARLIYRTAKPSPAQVGMVEDELRDGQLKGRRIKGPSGDRWLTTPADVADFLAARATHRQFERGGRKQAAAGPGASGGPRRSAADDLSATYHDVFRDYFLGLIFRRSQRKASRGLQVAITLSQAAIGLALLVLVLTAIRGRTTADTPQQQAVRSWIEQRHGEATIVRWHEPRAAAPGDGRVLRVEYRYKSPGGKSITTNRYFVVRGQRVITVESELSEALAAAAGESRRS